MDRFIELAKGQTPPLAEIHDLVSEDLPPSGGQGFRIFESTLTGHPDVTISLAIVACDLHPGHYSTKVAPMLGAGETVQEQHHHAHIASCMAPRTMVGGSREIDLPEGELISCIC